MAVRAVVLFMLALGAWRAWCAFRGDRTELLIVGLGFVARAIGGAVLFWMSYLQVPIGTTLQLGNGIWFFALDGVEYFAAAERAAAHGFAGIWNVDPTLASVPYIQALGLTILLVGPVTAAAVVLNLAAFLVTCLAIRWIAERLGSSRSARLLALSGASLMPSWILWSTQPLKDTLFVALIVCYLVPLVLWVQWLRRNALTRWSLAGPAVLGQCLALYCLAGIRWQFGLIVLVALAICAVGTVLSAVARGTRFRATIGVALSMLLLSQTVALAARAKLPAWAGDALKPLTIVTGGASVGEVWSGILEMTDRRRRGHILAGGSTAIRAPELGDPTTETPRFATQPDAVPPSPSPAAQSAGVSAGGVKEPQELMPAERMFLGMTAMFVPRFFASYLGLLEIGGGRGLFVFADADTLLLDVTLGLSIVLVVRSWRRQWVAHPGFWFVLAMTLLVAVPLAYEAGNFGTLFRQRNVVATGILLAPLFMVPMSGPLDAGR